MTPAELDALAAHAIVQRKAGTLRGRWHNDRPLVAARRERQTRSLLSPGAAKIARLFQAAQLEVAGLVESDQALRQMIVADLTAMLTYLQGTSVQVATTEFWQTRKKPCIP